MSHIPSFKQYLVDENKEVFFTFGRMNPPTLTDGTLMNTMSVKAGRNPYKVYLTQSNDARKNPLTYEQKIKWTRKMFPKHSRNIIMNKKVRNVAEVASSLYDQGFNAITLVAEKNQVTEFQTLLNKYNGKKGRHGFYVFERISVVSSGVQTLLNENLSVIEGNDFTSFSQNIPKSMSNPDAKKLFNDVRRGMGLKETKEFKNKIEFTPICNIREKYIEGELFAEGDRVVVKQSQQEGYVHRLGTNYVIVALDEGHISRQWLDNVELVENLSKQNQGQTLPDEGTDEAQKNARAVTPGQDVKICNTNTVDLQRAKKLRNKNTKSIKEEVSKKQIADLERFGDRLLNKFDIDIEFTRHFADRMNDRRNNPEIRVSEIQQLFKKIARNKGMKIKNVKGAEAVLKDLQSDLNLPIVVKFKNGEFEVINKTIMRKSNFRTRNKTIRYEETEVQEQEIAQTRNKIKKEKDRDRRRYDQMLDRARERQARRKSRNSKPKDVNI